MAFRSSRHVLLQFPQPLSVLGPFARGFPFASSLYTCSSWHVGVSNFAGGSSSTAPACGLSNLNSPQDALPFPANGMTVVLPGSTTGKSSAASCLSAGSLRRAHHRELFLPSRGFAASAPAAPSDASKDGSSSNTSSNMNMMHDKATGHKHASTGDIFVTSEPPPLQHFKLSRAQNPQSDPLLMQAGGDGEGKDKGEGKEGAIWDNPIPHHVYSEKELDEVTLSHLKPSRFHDYVARGAIKLLRGVFDLVTGYKGPGNGMTKRDWVNRCLFLETAAGVPGMVGGMARHLRSLRTLRRDYGWIHTLLEEAENERMHLLIFMNIKEPGPLFRTMVLLGQGVFFNSFVSYLLSPRTCHRFVGYLEEEAVKTYTGMLADLGQGGHLAEWGREVAPLIARKYYKLGEKATVYDMVRCIRADEANHRDVNHTFAGLDYNKGINPYVKKH